MTPLLLLAGAPRRLLLLLCCCSCLIAQTQSFTPPKSTILPTIRQHHHVTVPFTHHRDQPKIQHHRSLGTKLTLLPELSSVSSSILLSSETESWRQYVPLVVSVGVIIDILLGSPLANLALGPMKRASQKGATGDDSKEGSDNGGGTGSLFSSFGGNLSGKVVDKSKERVDSEAIAKAALDKAMYTLELKRFLEENKTDEQRYEEVRKKIERQMEDLDNSM